jgi:hypothetical protein
MKLIEDWKTAYRYMTVQLAALLGILSVAWEYVPQFQAYLDPAMVKWLALAMLIARVIQQGKPGQGAAQ